MSKQFSRNFFCYVESLDMCFSTFLVKVKEREGSEGDLGCFQPVWGILNFGIIFWPFSRFALALENFQS